LPVLNVFRMLGMLRGDRIEVANSGALPLDQVVAKSVTGPPDIGAVATRKDRELAVLLWNYHDDDIPVAPTPIHLEAFNVPSKSVRLEFLRMDADHSNSFAVWRKVGSPQQLTSTQQTQLEESSALQHDPVSTRKVVDHAVKLDFVLPRQGVCLVMLKW